MLNLDEIMDIKELHKQGCSIKGIVRQTGFSRNTVRSVVRGDRDGGDSRQPRRSKLDPFKDYLKQQYLETEIPVRRLFSNIRQLGYEGSIDQVYRFLCPLKQELRRLDKLTVRFETLPGEQAQVDWGYCGHVVDHEGKLRRLYVFAYVLSYSRACYVEFTTSMKLEQLIACHRNAFDYFGGVPEKILYDNMKQVRLDSGRLNPGFVDFAEYYGFIVKTCRPYRARTKGKVERLISYFKTNFLPGRSFSSLDNANAQAGHWMEYEANCRIHGTTGRRPCELLPEEKLSSHHGIAPYQPVVRLQRSAGFDGFVSYKGSHYTVPPEAAGRDVFVEHAGQRIRILCNDIIVTEHEAAAKKGSTVCKEEHLQAMWKLTLEQTDSPERKDVIRFTEEVQTRSLEIYQEVAR